jgi:hypothetical protein|nr:hypothetical protein [uncultured Methanoregula sp.]
MEIPDSIIKESRRTGEELHKAEIQKEIGDLKTDIDRTGAAISRKLQGSEAPAAAEEE